MLNTKPPFCENRFYHVYNRTNNREVLYKSNENKKYFLRSIIRFLGPFLNIYSYALLPNHFHLSISIKSIENINDYIHKVEIKDRTKTMQKFYLSEDKENTLNTLITHQFQRLFISYSQAINKRYNRSGNVFNRPFKRVLIDNESKFSYNQYYIHHNARKHGLVKNFEDYQWHSYAEILDCEETFLDRTYLFDWFGGKKEFIEFHNDKHLEKDFKEIYIEE